MLSRKFYKLLVDVAKRRDLKPSDKIVFAVIFDKIGDNGYCWPGVRTIAQDSGLTEKTVIKSIRRLEAVGLVTAERRGPGKSTHYYLTKSVGETTTVKKRKCGRKYNSGVGETTTEAWEKLPLTQTDTLNQTTESTSFAFVLRSKKLWHLSQAKLDEYTEAFPNLDVEAELHKAAQWLVDNPGRRKTARGMTRFLGGWLGRAKPKPEPKRGSLDWLPSDAEAEKLLAEIST